MFNIIHPAVGTWKFWQNCLIIVNNACFFKLTSWYWARKLFGTGHSTVYNLSYASINQCMMIISYSPQYLAFLRLLLGERYWPLAKSWKRRKTSSCSLVKRKHQTRLLSRPELYLNWLLQIDYFKSK